MHYNDILREKLQLDDTCQSVLKPIYIQLVWIFYGLLLTAVERIPATYIDFRLSGKYQ